MNQNNLLTLDLTKFTFDQTKYKTPTLHETWKWEGDETVLPYKWVNLIKMSNLYENKGETFNFEIVKKYLRDNYYGSNNFDKLSFFFITYRSEVTGCAYLDKNSGKIDYFLVNKKHFGKGIENGLFSLIYKRTKEIGLNTIYINMDLTNISEEFFTDIGFVKE
jgi:hypothetical protein